MRALRTGAGLGALVVALASPGHTAGSVTARLDGPRLAIDGDGAPNGVALTGGDQPGDVQIIGLDGTTVNGLPSWTAAGVRGVTVRMGPGPDRVEVRQVTIRGRVRIRLGNGDDSLLVVQARMRGPLDVRTGRGADGVTIGPQSDVHRLAHIRTGRDPDSVVVESSRISGLDVATGVGDDLIALLDTRVRGGARLFADVGEDDVLFQVVTFEADLRLNLGDDDDVLGLDTVFFEEDADLDGGADEDLLTVRGPLRFAEPPRVDDFE